MSQNSLILPTAGQVSGLQMTQFTNQALDTLNTLSSGIAAPVTIQPGQFWHDTTMNIINIRNLTNTAWIPLFYLDENSNLSAPGTYGQINATLNRLVNGEMLIDQAHEGASFSIPFGANSYACDMWQMEYAGTTGTATITGQRVSDSPPGFQSSLKVTVGTAQGSVAASDLVWMFQQIEGFNVSDLNYGTADAQTLSLSFWVKSSIAGTFSAFLFPSIAAASRGYIMPFTITTPNTWQQVKFNNIPGDLGGTYGTGNNVGLSLGFNIAAGSNYQDAAFTWIAAGHTCTSAQTNGVLTTAGATFQVTGVMLNAGVFCAPFDKRLINQTLIDCQRYYEKSYDNGVALATSTHNGAEVTVAGSSGWVLSPRYKATKRTDPSFTIYSSTGASGKVRDDTGSTDVSATASNIGENGCQVSWTSTSGHTYSGQWTADARF